MRRSLRASFLDASFLAKVFAAEPHSDIAREYFRAASTKYTAPFCFYEALNVLKSKWKFRGQLSKEQYFDAALQLTAWYSSSAQPDDLDFSNPTVFAEARGIAQRHDLDLSDALQILIVKEGYFSSLAAGSRTLLVTADAGLVSAAKAEGVLAWNVTRDPEPE